jgi:hypothetical protein
MNMRGCGLCLSLLNCKRGSSRRNEAGHRSSHSETFQDIASAHAFIISHDILPQSMFRTREIPCDVARLHRSKDIGRNPSFDHLVGAGESFGQT